MLIVRCLLKDKKNKVSFGVVSTGNKICTVLVLKKTQHFLFTDGQNWLPIRVFIVIEHSLLFLRIQYKIIQV